MDNQVLNEYFSRKRVLVTGACGTIGREVVRQLIEDYHVGELVGIDNNESDLFFLTQKYSQYVNVSFFLADVRDRDKMISCSRGIHVVIHTAAFKHVDLCERSPFEAVQTNIMGVQNVIAAAYENGIERLIFTSSDKAVNPTNVMGTSKLMGERLITAANGNLRGNGPIYASTRFGNVLGSRGSVIPLFRQQIRQGGPLTLTDPNMTRFIMSIREAAQLVINTVILACGGEVFITKMPVVRIQDLADVMIGELAPHYGFDAEQIQVQVIGSKPGEKMYEELMNHEEIRRVWELSRYFVVLPAFTSLYRQISYDYPDVLLRSVSNPYNSANEDPMDKKTLKTFLRDNHLLFEPRTDGEILTHERWD
ncbi:MAG: polysaccharide biosynthesis protein [Deltaproteobacteria bacterium]|nr:polysaccharide biosynthesis protein [Deltaproteobacteria bacterium]MBW2152312.1 polysaccharide biosynthesis protein [Deltaproteobacteria bacterium]